MNTSLLHTHRISSSSSAVVEAEQPVSSWILRQIADMKTACDNEIAEPQAMVGSAPVLIAPPPPRKRRNISEWPSPFSDPLIAGHFGEEAVDAHLSGERLIEDEKIRAAHSAKVMRLASDYRSENRSRKRGPKVRLPNGVIDAAYSAKMSLPTLKIALEVETQHLAAAIRRANFETILVGDVRFLSPSISKRSTPDSNPNNDIPDTKETVMATSEPSAAQEIDVKMTKADKEAELHALIAEHLSAHGVSPSIYSIQKSLGRSYDFVKAHWPSEVPRPTTVKKVRQKKANMENEVPIPPDGLAATELTVAEIVPKTDKALSSLGELASMVSELYYAKAEEMVAGYFEAANGRKMCDEVRVSDEGLVMLVKFWRTKAPEVEAILRLARELAPAA